MILSCRWVLSSVRFIARCERKVSAVTQCQHPFSGDSAKSYSLVGRFFSAKSFQLCSKVTSPSTEDPRKLIDSIIADHPLVIFSKTTCPFSAKIKAFFIGQGIAPTILEVDKLDNEGTDVARALIQKTGQTYLPSIWVNGKFIGGCNKTLRELEKGDLLKCIQDNLPKFDYDVLVIGGGTGGLAAAKEAARLGKKVALCDYVQPWLHLRRSYISIGCIPKKLMHQASLLGVALRDSISYGWDLHGEDIHHVWSKLTAGIREHIQVMKWDYKVQLRDNRVSYLNAYARFEDGNTVSAVDRHGLEKTVTATTFILAIGGSPKTPDIPGAKEYGITADEIFSLERSPGKTLVVGASYIGMECAGFLNGLGLNVTVLVRSILLRGFDQEIATKIGTFMAKQGVNFVWNCVATKLEKGGDNQVRAFGRFSDGTDFMEVFDTVIFATGRKSDSENLGLDKVGVMVNPENGKVIVDEREETSSSNIFAVGDIVDGKPELSPVAVQGGRLLARRISGHSDELANYDNIPVTIFTPLEYGCCGMAEEEALQRFGEENIDVFRSTFQPVELKLAHRLEKDCYMKLIVRKDDFDRVVGLHYLGPNAGEVTQGFAGMIAMGATKENFDCLMGIHPTCAEGFTSLRSTK